MMISLSPLALYKIAKQLHVAFVDFFFFLRNKSTVYQFKEKAKLAWTKCKSNGGTSSMHTLAFAEFDELINFYW